MERTDNAEHARAYYRAVDDGDYETLAGILADSFVHERPDRTLEGRDRFIRFMREERPDPDTEHRAVDVFESAEGRVAVEGELYRESGERLFGFVDVFGFDGERRVERLVTYVD
jgi:ketosteroid isomerase-like protein